MTGLPDAGWAQADPRGARINSHDSESKEDAPPGLVTGSLILQCRSAKAEVEREQRLIRCDGNSERLRRSQPCRLHSLNCARKETGLWVVIANCRFQEIEPPRHAFSPLPLAKGRGPR
jgi:hypothetical protein